MTCRERVAHHVVPGGGGHEFGLCGEAADYCHLCEGGTGCGGEESGGRGRGEEGAGFGEGGGQDGWAAEEE